MWARFNGASAPGIVRLGEDGTVDETLSLSIELGSYFVWAPIRHDLLFAPDGSLYVVGQYLRPGDQWPFAITKMVAVQDAIPDLRVASPDGQIVLTWSSIANANGYVLETKVGLGPEVSWVPVTEGIGIEGGLQVLRIASGGLGAFYRLHAP
jgi:hypothetical protein